MTMNLKTRGPRTTNRSPELTAIAYMQMLCNTFPILSLQLIATKPRGKLAKFKLFELPLPKQHLYHITFLRPVELSFKKPFFEI